MARRSLPWQISSKVTYREDDLALMDKQQVLDAFNLNWNVTLEPAAVYTEAYGGYKEIDGRFVTVRDNEFPLEIVGSRYKVTQNYEFIDLLADVRKRGLAEFSAGGSINEGRGVYAVMKLNQDVTIGTDPHAPYLIARTSHDGSCSFVVAPLLIRIGCTNAITRQLMNANAKYTKKHTLHSTLNVDDLISKIELAKHSISNYESIANKLIDTKMTDSDFENLIIEQFNYPKEWYGVPDDKLSRGEKVQRNRAHKYRQLASNVWYSSVDDTQANLYGTAYGAFQAIVEAIDHGSKGMNEINANKIILDDDSSAKAKALRLVTIGV